MTTTAGSLVDSAQALIDARLDMIERMLMGQMSRGDRLAIVREVEAQIHDLLAERRPDETDRSAVIAALARLDPPEAYLPDEAGEVARPASTPKRPQTTGALRSIPSAGGKAPGSIAGRVSCILGALSLVLLILTAMGVSGMVRNPDPVFVFTLSLLIFVTVTTSVFALTLAAYSRFSSYWAVIGLLAGLVSFFPVVLMILTSFVRGISPTPSMMTTPSVITTQNNPILSSPEPMSEVIPPGSTVTSGPGDINTPVLDNP